MKNIIFSLTIGAILLFKSLSFNCYAQSDTTFLSKNENRKVYIENNRKSEVFQKLLDPTIQEKAYPELRQYRLEELKESEKILKQAHPQTITKHNLYELPEDWIALHSYKGKYYVYSPCQIDTPTNRWLTDSCLYYKYLDGPFPVIIKSVEKKSDNLYDIKLWNVIQHPDNSRALDELQIHIIDKKRKISIWEYKSYQGESTYELLIPRKSAQHFDLIVCDCQDLDSEFDFDSIDFPNLILSH